MAADRKQEKRDKTAEQGVTRAGWSHGDLMTLYSHPVSCVESPTVPPSSPLREPHGQSREMAHGR